MKKSVYNFSLICGLLLTLAAFPVFAQNEEASFNKKPLQDFGQNVLDKVQKREVDLKSPFSLIMQGKLDEKGKFEKTTSKFTKSEGDVKIIEIAKQALIALSDSGLFFNWKQLGLDEVEISLIQTETEFSANFKSTFETVNRAKSTTSSLNMFLQMGKITVKDEDSKALLENSKVESIGKDFLLKFSMPLEQFHGIINKELEEAEKRQRLITPKS